MFLLFTNQNQLAKNILPTTDASYLATCQLAVKFESLLLHRVDSVYASSNCISFDTDRGASNFTRGETEKLIFNLRVQVLSKSTFINTLKLNGQLKVYQLI